MANDHVFSPLKQVRQLRMQKEASLQSIVSKYIDMPTNVTEADQIRLRQLAMTNGGLLKSEFRKAGWLMLTRTGERDLANNIKPPQEKLRAHKDYTQVAMDVRRALSRFPPGLTDAERLAMTDSLIDAIMRILCKNKELNYYQGFHDVVVTFLIVLGEDWTVAVLEKLCKTHFRDFMRPSIEQTQRFLQLVYVILGEANLELYDKLVNAAVGTMFCLPWLLTWFGHVLHSLDDILRIFDLFIAATPLVPLYLAAAIVLYYQPRILACPTEMADMHHLLTNLTGPCDDESHEAPAALRNLRSSPQRNGKRSFSRNVTHVLPVEEWVQMALDLYVEFPPENLFLTADADPFVARYLKLERDSAVASLEAVPLRRAPLGSATVRHDSRQLLANSSSVAASRGASVRFAMRRVLEVCGLELDDSSRWLLYSIFLTLLVALFAVAVALFQR